MGVGDSEASDGRAARVELNVDRSGTHPRVVIADSERERAWLSVLEVQTCSLEEWR